MFRRHCGIVYYMKNHPEIDYILFLDGDMGVINPNHIIEEYIDPSLDLIFYDRYYNYEIMAGAYIAKLLFKHINKFIFSRWLLKGWS